MRNPPVKSNWMETVIQIHQFHIHQLKDESNWTIQKTAKALNRSIGSVSQNLLVADWLKTHEKQLRRFRCMRDALVFVRLKKKEMGLTELEL